MRQGYYDHKPRLPLILLLVALDIHNLGSVETSSASRTGLGHGRLSDHIPKKNKHRRRKKADTIDGQLELVRWQGPILFNLKRALRLTYSLQFGDPTSNFLYPCTNNPIT